MQKITSAHSQFLFDVAATRRIEHRTASGLPPYTLMQRAGLAVARLTMAIAPHAQCIWVACGPGNNGGDGFEAAMHLHQWGKRVVVVTWTGPGKNGMPPDAHAAHARAIAAGVLVADEPPSDFDFCIDALFGIGADLDPEREGSAHILQWLKVMHDSAASCLAVDVPTGLNADTGQSIATKSVAACARIHWATARFLRFTLPILTLKPGLFTSEGRDSAGEVWFDDLGVDVPNTELPSAKLLGASSLASPQRLHSFHKGSFGDVAILGGESTASSHMAGAALLAASAALRAGAGRVFVAQYSTSGNDGKYTSSRYALVSGAWATASETPPYVLKTSGWELGNNSISGTFTSDGQGGGTAAETGNGRSFRFSARSVDLSGATFGSVAGLQAPAALAGSVFPSGSKLFWMQFAPLADDYRLYSGNQVNQMVCTATGCTNTVLANIAELMRFTVEATPLPAFLRTVKLTTTKLL